VIRSARGFKTVKTAYATINGFERMRAFRKGQAATFNITHDNRGEARLVERAFNLGPCALTEAVQHSLRISVPRERGDDLAA
jgi:IS6 family transposase